MLRTCSYKKNQSRVGFTLVEVIVVVAIVAILSSFVLIAMSGVRARGRDTKRKAELAQFGRFISLSCYMPTAGAGDYDLAQVLTELKDSNSKYAAMIGRTPKDPKTGTDEDTGYRYRVSPDGKRCVFYANLENKNEDITIARIVEPTPGGGTGTFEAGIDGRNGSQIYFQVSN